MKRREDFAKRRWSLRRQRPFPVRWNGANGAPIRANPSKGGGAKPRAYGATSARAAGLPKASLTQYPIRLKEVLGMRIQMKYAVLGVGLFMGLLLWPLAHADQTKVNWSVDGCEVKLEVPGTIDLGEAAPGEVLTSQAKDGEIEIESNCAYTVSISLDGFEKDGSTVTGELQDTLLSKYSFRVESVNPASKVQNLQPDFTNFGSIGEIKGVCASSADATPPFKNHKCKLQFRVETDLLPQGDYTASHTITASTP